MSDAGSFSSNIAQTHGRNWIKWLSGLIALPNIKGLELGSWKGESAEWMIDNIFTAPSAQYMCVDTFQGSDEHHQLGLDCQTLEAQCRARLERFGNRKEIIVGRSNEALEVLRDGYRFDFVYVDAAHDAMNVLRDAVLAFDLLKQGGIMVFDDYEWTAMANRLDRPKMAIDAFLSCYARRLQVIAVGWQVCIRKIE